VALVEVARFLDLTEAEVAASALRSGGIFVVLQNEVITRMDVNLAHAVGGVRLCVPQDDAADARAFIAEHRRRPSDKAPLPKAEAAARTAFSLLLTLFTGAFVPLRPKRPGRLTDDPPAG